MPINPKSKGIAALWLIITGFVLIAGGAGYFVIRRTLDTTPPKAPDSPSPKIVSVPAIDNMADDWKTYRNEKYGFEFKYPPNLVIEESLGRIWLSTGKSCATFRCPGGGIFVEDIDANHPTLDSIKSDSRNHMVTWSSDIAVSGQRAIQGISNEASGTPLVYVIFNGKLFALTWDISDPAILSTFKFIK